MSELKSLIKWVLVVAILIGGHYYYTHGMKGGGIGSILGRIGGGGAKITRMTPAGMTGDARCWIDLEFKNPPKGINPMDVRVTFAGPLLPGGSIEYGWNYIGSNAQRPKKAGIGWDKATDVSALAAPPLNARFSVNFPVPIVNETRTDADFDIVATLYWGGAKQSSRIGCFRYQYRTK